VVTADHGEEFQEHGRLKHGSQLYDESIRVPLVIAGPGIPPGRSAGLAQGIDLFPTIATILGLDASHLSGRNLLIPGTDDLVFSATRAGIAPDGTATEVLAVRSARWKLIFTPGLARYELYDLSDDPTESRNRFGEVPVRRAELRDLLAEVEVLVEPRLDPRRTPGLAAAPVEVLVVPVHVRDEGPLGVRDAEREHASRREHAEPVAQDRFHLARIRQVLEDVLGVDLRARGVRQGQRAAQVEAQPAAGTFFDLAMIRRSRSSSVPTCLSATGSRAFGLVARPRRTW